MVYFPGYAKVLSNKHYKDTNDNATFQKFAYEYEYKCFNSWAEPACTQKATKDKSKANNVAKANIKGQLKLLLQKEKITDNMLKRLRSKKQSLFFQLLPVVSSKKQKQNKKR